MRPVRFVLLTVAVLTIGVACNNATPPRTGQTQTPAASPLSTAATDEFAAIRTVYMDNCNKCHGETGGGGRVQIEGREIKVPNLTGEHARKPTDERLAAKIANGDDEMPAFKDKLSEAQIQELVRFIRKEFQ